jgi:peptide/nickel transport system permease protein
MDRGQRFAQVGRAIGQRLVQAALVSFLVGTLSFVMMWALPGDLAFRIAAGRYGYDMVTDRAAQAVREELQLERGPGVALQRWFTQLLRLDLGDSWVTGAPIVDEIRHQLGATLTLAFAGMALALVIGPLLGLVAGQRPDSAIDRLVRVGAIGVRALPSFLVGLALALVFSVQVGAFPAAGDDDNGSLVLPALTLAIALAAGISRVTRDAVAAVVRSPYYEFARLKGLSPRDALVWHGLRNAAVPVIAYMGVQMALLIEGVIVVETLFAWPGIGHALVHAIFGRDVPMIQGAALVMALLFVGLNLLVDLACLAADPRRR